MPSYDECGQLRAVISDKTSYLIDNKGNWRPIPNHEKSDEPILFSYDEKGILKTLQIQNNDGHLFDINFDKYKNIESISEFINGVFANKTSFEDYSFESGIEEASYLERNRKDDEDFYRVLKKTKDGGSVSFDFQSLNGENARLFLIRIYNDSDETDLNTSITFDDNNNVSFIEKYSDNKLSQLFSYNTETHTLNFVEEFQNGFRNKIFYYKEDGKTLRRIDLFNEISDNNNYDLNNIFEENFSTSDDIEQRYPLSQEESPFPSSSIFFGDNGKVEWIEEYDELYYLTKKYKPS